MIPAFNRLAELYLKRSMLERLLIAVICGAAVYLLLNLLLVMPQKKTTQNLLTLAQTHEGKRIEVQAQLAVLQSGDQVGRAQLAALQAERDALQQKIAAAGRLIRLGEGDSPALNRLVAELLQARPQVRLVGIKTLAVEKFYEYQPAPAAVPETKKDDAKRDKPKAAAKPAPAAPATPPAPPKTVYAHGVEVSVQGRYLDLLDYLQAMQQFPGQLFWRSANLQVGPYPESVLRLVIYTLSDQEKAPL